MGVNGGWGEIKKASASTPSANEQAKDAVLVHTVQLEPMIKAQISGGMISSDISTGRSDRFSILQENPSEEVDYDNYYYDLLQETTVFGGRLKLTSVKLRPEK